MTNTPNKRVTKKQSKTISRCPICGEKARLPQAKYCSLEHARQAERQFVVERKAVQVQIQTEQYRQELLEIQNRNLELSKGNLCSSLELELLN